MSKKGGDGENSYQIRGQMCAWCGVVKGITPGCVCTQPAKVDLKAAESEKSKGGEVFTPP